jgi:4,5-DOPA dioxygenase extradiol
MPSVFAAHASPYLFDDAAWASELRRWAREMPRPTSILVLSAHWFEQRLTIGATCPVPLIYDFDNHPERYYELVYPAPGASALAARVRELGGRNARVDDALHRGLDHGAWVPLLAMYPKADIPVLQVALPALDPVGLMDLGRALAPLRDEGTLILASGTLTHNLRSMDLTSRTPVPAWAMDLDTWCAERLATRDVDALIDYRRRAPGVDVAHATHEHFLPLFVALGASVEASETIRSPITGFTWSTITKRSFQFG